MLFKGSVRSEEPSKVLGWVEHILVPLVVVDMIGVISSSFRIADITLFFAHPYLQFTPRLGEPVDTSINPRAFVSRLEWD